jgi:hypothetical protein
LNVAAVAPMFCTMNGVNQWSVPPKYFRTFGRYTTSEPETRPSYDIAIPPETSLTIA